MGNKAQSAERNGDLCAGGCGCNLPTDHIEFDKALHHQPEQTNCYYSKTDDEVSITTGAKFGLEGPEASVDLTVAPGEKIYLYFLKIATGEYFCWDCLVEKDPKWAKSIYLSLFTKGHICSYQKSTDLT
jgi:hypothetical protein